VRVVSIYQRQDVEQEDDECGHLSDGGGGVAAVLLWR